MTTARDGSWIAATRRRAQICGLVNLVAAPAPSALATLLVWLPFILKGFALNLIISFLAMALATLLGIGLGLMQISLHMAVGAPARFVTHLFRNSPWLVILFVAATVFDVPSVV